jgi:DNA-binding PadR family transcriptional regulator
MRTAKGAATKGKNLSSGALTRPQGAPRGLLYFYALWKISKKPSSGYDLMQDIESKTEGAWRPGPGAIYPVLKKLSGEKLITPHKDQGASPHTVYAVTQAGLDRIALVKKTMKSSGERWSLMRRVFSDILEPEDLVKFVVEAPSRHFDFVHELVLSSNHGICQEDKLYLLKHYNLLIEKELRWGKATLAKMEDAEGVLVGGARA